MNVRRSIGLIEIDLFVTRKTCFSPILHICVVCYSNEKGYDLLLLSGRPCISFFIYSVLLFPFLRRICTIRDIFNKKYTGRLAKYLLFKPFDNLFIMVSLGKIKKKTFFGQDCCYLDDTKKRKKTCLLI